MRKEKWLEIAEIIDAFITVPRLLVSLYGIMVYSLFVWFTSMKTVVQTTCDAAVIEVILQSGKSLEEAQAVACTVSSMVGGPTTAQSAFVTAIIGLSTAVFAFYVNTGRAWVGKPDKIEKPKE